MTYKFKLSRRLAMAWRRLIGASAVLLGCNPGSISQSDTQAENITAVAVHPSAMQLAPGAIEYFRAYARLITGDSVPISVTWQASAGNITPEGVYTAPTQPGAYLVDATHPEKLWLSSSAQVTVESLALELFISPKRTTIQPNDSVEFRAVVLNTAGDTVPMDITFTSSSGTVTKKGRALGHFKPNGSRGNHKVIAEVDSAGLSDTADVEVVDTLVASVTVIPSSLSLNEGQSYSLTAELRDLAGNALTGRSVRWSSARPQSVAVDPFGSVTAVASGSATIIAESEGVTGQAEIAVNPTPVGSVGVTPSNGALLAGGSLQLIATVRDLVGNVLPGRTVAWSSSAPSIATVDVSGLVVGITAGSGTITATSDRQVGTAIIAVSLVPVASIAVSPGSAALIEGETLQLTATPLDSAGQPLPNRAVAWTSSSPTVASVDGSGLLTASAGGAATITASSEGQSAAISAIVTRVPVGSVTVTGGTGTVEVGGITQLQAATRDSAGNLLANRVVTWSSSNSGIATVSSGLVAGVAVGSAIITATSEGRQGIASMTVTPPPTPATPLFEEDFSGYTATPYLLTDDNNPWTFTAIGPGGAIVLDQTRGFGSSSQSMRYDYPDNDSCGNYTIGRSFHERIAPYDQLQNFWVEYIISFSSNWRTAQSACTSGFADHKTIEIFPLPTGSTRWEVKIGAGGLGFQTSSPQAPPNQVNESPINTPPPYDALTFWDDNWKVVRVQVGNFGSGVANGIWRIWFDNGTGMRLVHEQTNLLYEVAGTGIKHFWIGQNRNLGQDEVMDWSVGRIRVYSDDPGW